MPQERASVHLKARLTRFTEHTLTTRQQLDQALTLVRKYGYAIDREENELGCVCYAAPIFGWGDVPGRGHLGVGADRAAGPIRSICWFPKRCGRMPRRFPPVLKQTAGVAPKSRLVPFPARRRQSGRLKPLVPTGFSVAGTCLKSERFLFRNVKCEPLAIAS